MYILQNERPVIGIGEIGIFQAKVVQAFVINQVKIISVLRIVTEAEINGVDAGQNILDPSSLTTAYCQLCCRSFSMAARAFWSFFNW